MYKEWYSHWEDNISVAFLQTGRMAVEWIDLVQDTYKWQALVNAVMNL
jgi:hypothetical protein